MFIGYYILPTGVLGAVGMKVALQVAADVFARFLVLKAEETLGHNAVPKPLPVTGIAWFQKEIPIIFNKCSIRRPFDDHESVAWPRNPDRPSIPLVADCWVIRVRGGGVYRNSSVLVGMILHVVIRFVK